MTESDRLIGAFEEFKKWEAKEHDYIREDLKDIKYKVDSLRLWKATMLGASSVVGALAGYLASLIR